MGQINGADIVRIGGKTYTKGRALAQGLIDGEGNLTKKAERMLDSQGQKAERRDESAAAWRKSQGLPPLNDGVSNGESFDPASRKIEPLRPQNVDHDGNPITDEETLAAIAAQTAGPDDPSGPQTTREKQAIIDLAVEKGILEEPVSPDDYSSVRIEALTEEQGGGDAFVGVVAEADGPETGDNGTDLGGEA